MKILLLGGSGFIGPFVVKELIELGHELAVFNRGLNNSRLPNDQISFITGDKEELYNYRNEFRNFGPDVVIHFGAYTKSDANLVLETFEGISERLIVLSSMDVYRAYGKIMGLEEGISLLPTPLTETSPLRDKLYPYGGDYEKIVVEKLIMESSSISGTILRLPMVYGPGDPSHRLYKYAKRIEDQRKIMILDEHFANWRVTRGYVENVAHAISLAATDTRASNEIYNVGEPVTRTEHEWLASIGRNTNWEGEIWSIPREELPVELIYSTLNFDQDWSIDISKIGTDLHFNDVVDFDEGLRRTISWELRHPPMELNPMDFPRLDYLCEDQFISRYKFK